MTRILIVDDQPENLYLLRAMLQGQGYIVDEARNGAEALDKARLSPPHLVIADLLMPVMDGYTLLSHWKADSDLRTVPFVVYTATYTDPRDEQLAIDLGVDAFIVKPAEPEPFMIQINDLLNLKDDGKLKVNHPLQDEAVILKQYNEVLIHKLEQKAFELEKTNAQLKKDLADRTLAQEAAQRASDLLQAVADGTPDAVFVKDREGKYLLFNEAAAQFVGKPVEEVLGNDDSALFSPDEVAQVRQNDVLVMESNRSWTKEEVLTAAAVKRIYLATKAPYRDSNGKVIGILGISRDITQYRNSEHLLRLREKAIQVVSEGITIADPNQPDSPLIYVSAGFERITGYSWDEAVGRNCRFLQGPETGESEVRQIREAIAAQQPCSVEILNYRKDGSQIWNALSITPVFDDEERLAYFVGVQTDITKRRNLEERLRQAQKMEAVGQLAGGVAHDFNNLLTIISGYCELTTDVLDDPAKVSEYINVIQDAGRRAAMLTGQLLAFSRQTILEPQILDLNSVVAESAKLLRRLIPENIHFALELDPGLRNVCLDPGHINQVLMNLAVNSRDAMPKGGQLTIRTANILLDTGHAEWRPECQPGPHVKLSVSDTGCGMPPEVVARIFEPFFTTKGVGKGTGLGLATVFGIVRQSDGHIEVDSEVGRGTTFHIYFPAATEELAPDMKRNLNPERGGSETILLVEDEEAVRNMARLALEGLGYHVIPTASGQEAIHIAPGIEGGIDLLLTDVVMPDLSGPDLADRLHPLFPKMKVLFMSGYTDDDFVRQGILHATVSFLQKPYTPARLGQKVRQTLDQSVS